MFCNWCSLKDISLLWGVKCLRTLIGVLCLLLCGHWKIKKGDMYCRPNKERGEEMALAVWCLKILLWHLTVFGLAGIFLLKLIYYGTRLFIVEILDEIWLEMIRERELKKTCGMFVWRHEIIFPRILILGLKILLTCLVSIYIFMYKYIIF